MTEYLLIYDNADGRTTAENKDFAASENTAADIAAYIESIGATNWVATWEDSNLSILCQDDVDNAKVKT